MKLLFLPSALLVLLASCDKIVPAMLMAAARLDIPCIVCVGGPMLGGIESVRKNSQREGAFELKDASNGKSYFVLKATNGQVVGQSQMYASEASCKNGIESVKKNAPDAVLQNDA